MVIIGSGPLTDNQRTLNIDSIPAEQRGSTVEGTLRKVLRPRTDRPVPKGALSEGGILVKVQAAGLNRSILR